MFILFEVWKVLYVYHLICFCLYTNKYSFQEVCEKSSSIHVSQAIALKTKHRLHLL